ncbi:MAG: class I SAM-dependent methyltransferase [Candidatus Omnitrophica bacterium]|nr:class I SAM-dependent methyltransferase [Candidatus Omnitrophota bacterium]
MKEWFEDESFWSDLYCFMFNEARFEQADMEADDIIQLLPFQGASMLDLGCGPGRFTLAFSRRGYRMTGVDKSEFLLGKAMEKSLAAGLTIEWIHDDMREFRRPGTFDLILNLFSSFGYFRDKNDDMIVLKNMYDNLKPGGKVLFELMSKECMARIYQETISEELEDGSLLIHRHKITEDWTRIENEWIHIKDGSAKTFRPILTLYSAQELKDRLGRTGFREMTVYGGWDGRPYNEKAQRMVVIAKKQ